MRESTLYQRNPYLKNLSVWCEKSEEFVILNDIIFYNDNGIVAKVGSGYFDSGETFSFKGEVIKKRKEDFSKKINYVIKKGDYTWDNDYALYIYVGNVDLKYIGLEKQYDYVYKKYEVNNISFNVFAKALNGKLFEYSHLIDMEKEKIKSYDLPLDEKEINKILKNIRKYNKLMLEEKEFINNYIPNEEDLKEEDKKEK